MSTPAARAGGALLGALGGVAIATAFYSIAIERKAYRIRFEELPILPEGSRPIAILHLADIHLAPWQRRTVDWLQGLRDLEPDFIINTGDSLGHRDSLRPLAEALAPFAGIPGVFVHGSNDYYGPTLKNPLRYIGFPQLVQERPKPQLDIESLERIYDAFGWADLNNSAASFTVRGTELSLVGTGDAHIELDDIESAEEALQALPAADVTLGVTHAPYTHVLDGLAALGADALVAGHTHGGQVRIPGGPALTTNSDLPVEHADGLTTWRAGGRDVPLQVSAGIGTSMLAPFRLGTPPEAVLLTLTARR